MFFQYAVTVALNYEERSSKKKKIKPFINKYN